MAKRIDIDLNESLAREIVSKNGKYKKEFERISGLGSGGFGSVYKVKDKTDNQLYAIKKIKLFTGFSLKQISKGLNESLIWEKIKNEFCVEYKTTWVEQHLTDNIPVIYIQTELCLMDLRKGMSTIHTELNYNKDKINSNGLFIASELFHEICQGVNYLHSMNPPIIHRDLKPENVLITNGKNGNFIKICDFGLATGHAHRDDFIEEMFKIKSTHTANIGTIKYMAPEMVKGKDYDTAADLFSSGIIMGELFCIDSTIFNYKNTSLKTSGNIDETKVRECIDPSNHMENEIEIFAHVVIKYLQLIHPDKLERKFVLNSHLVPFDTIKHKNDMNVYCSKFESHIKPDINSLSDFIISKKFDNRQKKPIWFGVKEPVKLFTGRDIELKRLHDALQSECGQIISISGSGGIGKSELARMYAHQHKHDYDDSVVWINARTQESLRNSFRKLAEELEIPLKEQSDEIQQERNIRSIVNDIYKYLGNAKSLFILDNAEKFKDIHLFLPSSFSLSPYYNKPHILITSRNRNWKLEEKEIQVVPLDVLTPENAEEYIRKAMKFEDIKNGFQKREIRRLAEQLQYFPSALQRAVSYTNKRNEIFKIRGKKFQINDYLKGYQGWGYTPLHMASFRGSLDLVKYLIEEKGANFKAVNSYGHTILHNAAQSGNLDIVKYLIEEKGTNFKDVDNYRYTILHFAAKSGNLDIVKYLIEEKCFDFKDVTDYGLTLLHLSAQSGNLDLVKYLIEEKGADFKAFNSTGDTPLDFANTYGYSHIIKYLKDKFRNFNN